MNSIEEEYSIDVERALSRAQHTVGHLNTLHKVQGVVDFAKDVAASVNRSRVLGKNTMITQNIGEEGRYDVSLDNRHMCQILCFGKGWFC